MATRKRSRTGDGQCQADDPATPQNEAFEPITLPISVDALAEFIGDDQPDPEQLRQALALAVDAAAAFTGTPVGDTAPHLIRQGINLMASQLLITNQLEGPPSQEQIPLVVRAFWRLADAGNQPI